MKKPDTRTLKLAHRYLVLPSSVTIRITLLHILYTYSSHQNYEKLSIFNEFFRFSYYFESEFIFCLHMYNHDSSIRNNSRLTSQHSKSEM